MLNNRDASLLQIKLRIKCYNRDTATTVKKKRYMFLNSVLKTLKTPFKISTII